MSVGYGVGCSSGATAGSCLRLRLTGPVPASPALVIGQAPRADGSGPAEPARRRCAGERHRAVGRSRRPCRWPRDPCSAPTRPPTSLRPALARPGQHHRARRTSRPKDGELGLRDTRFGGTWSSLESLAWASKSASCLAREVCNRGSDRRADRPARADADRGSAPCLHLMGSRPEWDEELGRLRRSAHGHVARLLAERLAREHEGALDRHPLGLVDGHRIGVTQVTGLEVFGRQGPGPVGRLDDEAVASRGIRRCRSCRSGRRGAGRCADRSPCRPRRTRDRRPRAVRCRGGPYGAALHGPAR